MRGRRRSVIGRTLAAALCCGTAVAACADVSGGGTARMASPQRTDMALDSLFPRLSARALIEDPGRPIASVMGGDVDAAGTIYLADAGQRAVMRFDSSGSFAGLLGGTGSGPGEYQAPVRVRRSPFRDVLLVTDLVLRRAVVFDRASLAYDTAVSLAGGALIPVQAMLGPGDTIVVTGTNRAMGGDTLFEAELVVRGSVVRRFFPRPRALRDIGVAVNTGRALGAQTVKHVYLIHNADPVLYRYRYDGSPVDSVSLPPALYVRPALPESIIEPDARRFVKTYRWVRGVVPLDDTTLVVEINSFDAARDDWVNEHVLLRWGNAPRAWSSRACVCQLIASQGDTLVFLHGSPGDGQSIERRIAAFPPGAR